MYSEHAVSTLMPYVTGTYRDGAALDQHLTRTVVEVGRIIGGILGCLPSDSSLAWWAAKAGTPAVAGTRAAVHVLPDGRTGFGLGPARGVIETVGDRLVIVRHPHPDRYTGVYLLPTIEYGGLL